MRIKNLIVQASGKGSRLEEFTWNKPKALISIFGNPLLYHLKKAFPEAKFYIIGDYKYDVLKTYLEINKPPFDYVLFKSQGEGSCQGLRSVIHHIMNESQANHVAITWCDLLYGSEIQITDFKSNFVGITNKLKCRWQFLDGKLVNIEGSEAGVFGFFYFSDLSLLEEVPESGEFVKYLSNSSLNLKPLLIEDVIELGTKEIYIKTKSQESNSRFFNRIKINGNKVIKECVVSEFMKLLNYETNWYRYISKFNFSSIPKIYNYDPLTLEFFDGKHPHELDVSNDQKKKIVYMVIKTLKSLHAIDYKEMDIDELIEVYVNKTIARIQRISSLIPYRENKYYIVNDRKIKNLFYEDNLSIIEEVFNRLKKPKNFSIIHGDPTFSNILVSNDLTEIKLIDPRGYFGNKEIYGDPYYDFAKLYYSVVGNYDKFNRFNFSVKITKRDNGDVLINLNIDSSKYEDCDEVFLDEFSHDEYKSIKILHGLIWLALTSYALDNVDSVIGAYFKGLEVLSEVAGDLLYA
ncbi:MAG: NTP transferase domain-containing protein [Candidatus Micrarchaeota archaeon]|nr:NTP transferase domain-containing protein [Candidatus Micrarchaeota archaeon]